MKNPALYTKRMINTVISDICNSREQYFSDNSFSRKRELPLDVLLKQLIFMGSKSVEKELLETGFTSVSRQSFSKAVKKVPDDLMKNLLTSISQKFSRKLFHDYHLVAVDGMYLSLKECKDNPEVFMKPNQMDSCTSRILVTFLYDIQSGIFLDFNILPAQKANERQSLIAMIQSLQDKEHTILICDRGYESIPLVWELEKLGLKYIIRAKDSTSNGTASMSELSVTHEDDISIPVTLVPSKREKRRFHGDGICSFVQNLEKPISDFQIRLCRFHAKQGNFITIMTNLDKKEFPPDIISSLYRLRWKIELAFRSLKHDMSLLHLHTKRYHSAIIELYARVIGFNCIKFSLINQNEATLQRSNGKRQVNHSYAVTAFRQYYLSKIRCHEYYKLLEKHTCCIKADRSYFRKERIGATPKSFSYRTA